VKARDLGRDVLGGSASIGSFSPQTLRGLLRDRTRGSSHSDGSYPPPSSMLPRLSGWVMALAAPIEDRPRLGGAVTVMGSSGVRSVRADGSFCRCRQGRTN